MKIMHWCVALLLAGLSATSRSAELKLLAPIALEPVLKVLILDFNATASAAVSVSYGTAGALVERAKKGEDFDVLITSKPLIEKLENEEIVVKGSLLDVGKVGVGAFVRQGFKKPDITSVEAFKMALLDLNSIGVVDPASGAPTGIYMQKLIARLGLSEQIDKKTKLIRLQDRVDAIVNGDVDIGFNQISEILADPRVEYVGPLPPEIQNFTSFVAGVGSKTGQPDLAKAFVAFLGLEHAREVFKRKGFD
jgi:molybdate transport system substrate-binding protein